MASNQHTMFALGVLLVALPFAPASAAECTPSIETNGADVTVQACEQGAIMLRRGDDEVDILQVVADQANTIATLVSRLQKAEGAAKEANLALGKRITAVEASGKVHTGRLDSLEDAGKGHGTSTLKVAQDLAAVQKRVAANEAGAADAKALASAATDGVKEQQAAGAALARNVSALAECSSCDAQEGIQRHLLAWYCFDEQTSDDCSSNKRHGKWAGAERSTGAHYTKAGDGFAARFDGASGILVRAFIGWDFGRHFSVSLWFKRTSQGGWQTVASTGYARTGSWELRTNHESPPRIGGGVITMGHDKAWDHPAELLVDLDVWHHVGMTYDAELAHTYFYLNGKFTGPALKDAGPMKLSTWPLMIGTVDGSKAVFNGVAKCPVGAEEFFIGLIDDVRVYKTSLTSADYKSLYDVEKPNH